MKKKIEYYYDANAYEELSEFIKEKRADMEQTVGEFGADSVAAAESYLEYSLEIGGALEYTIENFPEKKEEFAKEYGDDKRALKLLLHAMKIYKEKLGYSAKIYAEIPRCSTDRTKDTFARIHHLLGKEKALCLIRDEISPDLAKFFYNTYAYDRKIAYGFVSQEKDDTLLIKNFNAFAKIYHLGKLEKCVPAKEVTPQELSSLFGKNIKNSIYIRMPREEIDFTKDPRLDYIYYYAGIILEPITRYYFHCYLMPNQDEKGRYYFKEHPEIHWILFAVFRDYHKIRDLDFTEDPFSISFLEPKPDGKNPVEDGHTPLDKTAFDLAQAAGFPIGVFYEFPRFSTENVSGSHSYQCERLLISHEKKIEKKRKENK